MPRSASWSSLLVTLVMLAAPAVVFAQSGRALSVTAQAVLLIDPSGKILFAKNAEDDRAPASLVKLMTLYLACEDLDAGRVHLDEMVTVSAHAAATPRYRMGLRAGQEVELRVLLEGVAIASANDAATALAERLAGDEATFVARMNDKARELGLAATRFANPHGLPDPLQRSNARDLVELTGRLIADHAMVRPLLGGQTFIWNGRVYTRHIPLFKDPGGVQALKTGFTKEAGYNLAVSAWRAGQQYLMIVLGARSRAHSFLDARKVLHYGFVETGIEPRDTPKPSSPKPPLRTRRTRSTGS
ncbi:MAG TPA: D-alanyl-D-alanine carboxypeptidase family protein [Candidatus Limnocylindria bacterium]|nr:D-alanyl-D-alanine carboxypeptidase family protein [Candidatus Limnocylindria bacterium]